MSFLAVLCQQLQLHQQQHLPLPAGQHHLETVITIRNVVNLTLVGANSGVKILCHSPQSGLTVERFHFLAIENMTFSECSHEDNHYYNNISAVVLNAGSEISLNHVTISKSSSDSKFTGLSVSNVIGSFSIRSSAFYAPMGSGIIVLYPLSNRSSHFEFIDNKVSTHHSIHVQKVLMGYILVWTLQMCKW